MGNLQKNNNLNYYVFLINGDDSEEAQGNPLYQFSFVTFYEVGRFIVSFYAVGWYIVCNQATIV